MPTAQAIDYEQFNFGKLVSSQNGPTRTDHGVTSKTVGVCNVESFLPKSIIGTPRFQERNIDPASTERGALAIRLAPEAPDWLGVMRARFRSEAGEKIPGRQYLQSTSLQIEARKGWQNIPAWFPSWCLNTVRADPDLETETNEARFQRKRRSVACDKLVRDPIAAIAGTGRERSDRIALIVIALITGQRLVLGHTNYADSAQGTEFGDDLTLALSACASVEIPVSHSTWIGHGLASSEVEGGLLLCPSEVGEPVTAGLFENIFYRGVADLSAPLVAAPSVQPAQATVLAREAPISVGPDDLAQ